MFRELTGWAILNGRVRLGRVERAGVVGVACLLVPLLVDRAVSVARVVALGGK